jgi:DNA-binding MarR family transcriptional regulator
MAQRSRSGDGLDHGILPDLIGYQLRLAQLAVFRDFERTVGDLGISPGRVGVLVLVSGNPGITQSRLAEAVGLDRSTLVPVLDALERRGLVERRRGKDRRTNGLWLTVTGKRLLIRVKQRITAHERRMVSGMSDDERTQLVALLARLRSPS